MYIGAHTIEHDLFYATFRPTCPSTYTCFILFSQVDTRMNTWKNVACMHVCMSVCMYGYIFGGGLRIAFVARGMPK